MYAYIIERSHPILGSMSRTKIIYKTIYNTHNNLPLNPCNQCIPLFNNTRGSGSIDFVAKSDRHESPRHKKIIV